MKPFYFLAILAILFSSCVTQKRCSEKFPPQVVIEKEHTIETIRKDSLLPGATVTHTIVKDSLVLLPVNKWRVIRDTSGLAELRYYKDAYGNILAQCQATDRMVEKIEQRVKEQLKSTEKNVVTQYRTPWWCWLLIGGLLSLCLVLYLYARFKNLFG